MTESQEHQNSGNYPLPKNSINPDTDLGWIKRLLPVARSHRRPLIIGVCVGSVALILNVAVPAIGKEAIDSTIAGNREEITIWALILIVVGLGRFATGALLSLIHI